MASDLEVFPRIVISFPSEHRRIEIFRQQQVTGLPLYSRTYTDMFIAITNLSKESCNLELILDLRFPGNLERFFGHHLNMQQAVYTKQRVWITEQHISVSSTEQ